MKSEKFQVVPPPVTRSVAGALFLHHIGMAMTYFEAMDNEQVAGDLDALRKEDERFLIVAYFMTTLQAYYDCLEDPGEAENETA